MKAQQILTLTAMVVLIAIACTKKNSNPNTNLGTPGRELNFSKYAEMGLDSPFINRDSANKMISSYLMARQSDNEIKALIVDADALRYYLQNTDIKHVKLMFAHKMSYIRAGHEGVSAGYDNDKLTIVIAGYSSDNNYIYSPQGAVMDFCQPCPYNCPESGTAANDLLPNASTDQQ